VRHLSRLPQRIDDVPVGAVEPDEQDPAGRQRCGDGGRAGGGGARRPARRAPLLRRIRPTSQACSTIPDARSRSPSWRARASWSPLLRVPEISE
jgi:hypothetical protein